MKVRESTPPQETRRFSVADTRQQPLENQSVMVPSVSQSVTPFLQLSKVTLARVRLGASPIRGVSRHVFDAVARLGRARARARGRRAAPVPRHTGQWRPERKPRLVDVSVNGLL